MHAAGAPRRGEVLIMEHDPGPRLAPRRLLMLSDFKISLFVLLSVSFCNSGFSQNQPIAVEVGKPIEVELKGGETHDYTIQLPPSQFINVVLTQKGVDAIFTLLGPDGTKKVEVDTTGKTGPEPIWFVADTGGAYVLRVSAVEKTVASGRYVVQWNESSRATDDLRNFAAASNLVIEGVMIEAKRKFDPSTTALAKFDEAARLYEKIQDHKQAKAGGFARMGRVYRSAKRNELALSYFDRAIDIFLEIGQKREAMLNLVETQGLAADSIEFIKRNEKVRDLAIEIGDRGYQTGALMQIAQGHYDLGNFPTAVRTIRAALAIAIEENDERRLEGIYNNMGAIYTAQGDLVAAFEAHDRSVAMQLKRTGGKLSGDALLNIGNVYNGFGKYDVALDYYARALEQFEKLNANVGISYAVSNMGVVYLQMGNYDKALEYFLRAKPLKAKFLPKDPQTTYNIASTYKLKGEYNKALENAHLARELCQSTKDAYHEAETVIMISELQLLLGDAVASLKTAGQAEEIARRFELDKSLWESLEASSNANLKLGNAAKAREQLESAIAIIERIRAKAALDDSSAENYFEGKANPYASLIGILIAERQDLRAFEIAERTKARSLLDTVKSGRVNISKAMSDGERNTENRLRSELAVLNSDISKQSDEKTKASLEDRLDRKRLEFEDFRTRLYAANPQLRIQRGDIASITPDELNETLSEQRSAIVEYVTAADKSFAFIVTKRSNGSIDVRAHLIPLGRDAILTRVKSIQTGISNGDLDFQDSSKALYSLLIKPLENELAAKTNIVIVPDGPLWDLPFQALMDEKGKYLIEKAAVSYAPSLTALREMSKKAKTRKPSPDAELLAFGNPIVGKETKERVERVFMSEKLEPIPEAERLVNELGKMYGPKRSKVFTGADAREETAKKESPNYRIVQFATHGILNNVSPMYSHLVMAQDARNPNEDGLLEAWELKDLDLKADMVILSACETARGKIANGEGIIGMTWASFIAGAPTTVASQWKVESSSTTELMLEFHRQLLSKKPPSKAEALRRASLKLMKMPRYRHPRYWGGFVLVGDGS